MLVSDLIEQLKSMPEDAEVHFGYDYGDYWHTSVAPEVNNIDEMHIKYSDYHRMDKIVDEPEEEDGSRLVVVLSA